MYSNGRQGSTPTQSGSSKSKKNEAVNFNDKYASNIAGLAKANGVDLGVAAAYLKSNLAGTAQYKGGGVVDYGQANRDLYADTSARINTQNSNTQSNSTPSYYDQYRSVLDQQLKAQQEAIAKQTQATVDSINAYRPQVEQSYADQQKANYIANAKNQSQMGDYLGAMGYSGGMAESTMANLNNTYQNNRSAADTEKNNAMLTLDQQVAQARASGDTSLADAANSYFTNYLSAMQNQQQFDYQKQLQEQQNYASTTGAYYDDYQAQINKLLDAGVSEDDYRIKTLQAARNQKLLDQQELARTQAQQTLENAQQQQQIDYTTGKPYYKATTSSKSSGGMTYSQALAAYKAGIETPAVLSMLGLN